MCVSTCSARNVYVKKMHVELSLFQKPSVVQRARCNRDVCTRVLSARTVYEFERIRYRTRAKRLLASPRETSVRIYTKSHIGIG